jgi:cysteine sulfinate desulfinase/cysteine desulfurase-like protein
VCGPGIEGAQSIPHIPIDVQALGADFFVFSGHKNYGPTGIGVLYGCEEALEETPPWQGGGNMIADVTLERSLYQGPPNKFEAGTGNIADAVGLGEALRYLERVGIERMAAYEHALLEYATPRLADIDGVRLVGTAREKASVLSFVLAGHEPLEVGKALNAEGIAVRARHHCASRSCGGSAWRRRCGRRSRSTTRTKRSTCSSTRCAALPRVRSRSSVTISVELAHVARLGDQRQFNRWTSRLTAGLCRSTSPAPLLADSAHWGSATFPRRR